MRKYSRNQISERDGLECDRPWIGCHRIMATLRKFPQLFALFTERRTALGALQDHRLRDLAVLRSILFGEQFCQGARFSTIRFSGAFGAWARDPIRSSSAAVDQSDRPEINTPAGLRFTNEPPTFSVIRDTGFHDDVYVCLEAFRCISPYPHRAHIEIRFVLFDRWRPLECGAIHLFILVTFHVERFITINLLLVILSSDSVTLTPIVWG